MKLHVSNEPTNPISPAVPIGRSAFPGGQNVRNKPNSGWREDKGKCFVAKGLRGIRAAKDFGKTKPLPRAGRTGSTAAGTSMRNKANSRSVKLEESSFKQTKPMAESFGSSNFTLGTAAAPCEKNPMCPAAPSLKSEVSSVLPTSAFAPETSEAPPEGGTPNKTCETKPIPPRAARRVSTFGKKDYDELDMQKASAKQSQFPHGGRPTKAGKAAGGAHRTKQSQSAPQQPEKVVGGADKHAKQSQFPLIRL